MSALTIVLVYPELMGTYGDGGNAVALRARCTRRGIDAEVLAVHAPDPVPRTADVYLIGGAENASQTTASNLLRAEGEALGLSPRIDFAGNLFLTLPGADRSVPAWATGSHLDSVPQGGNYDGAAGVVAGLAVLKALRKAGRVPPRDIVLAAFRAEETSSWYHGDFGGHIGSRDDGSNPGCRRDQGGRAASQDHPSRRIWHLGVCLRSGQPTLHGL